MTGLASGEGGITGLAAGVAADGTATAAQSIAACSFLYEAPLGQYPLGNSLHQRGAGGDAVLERDLLLLSEGETLCSVLLVRLVRITAAFACNKTRISRARVHVIQARGQRPLAQYCAPKTHFPFL